MRINFSTNLIAVVALCCFGSISCSKDDDDDKNSPTAPQDIQGDWESECIDDDGLFQKHYATIAGFEITVLHSFYSAEGCTEGSKMADATLIGKYKTGTEAASATTVPGAIPIDIALSTFVIRPQGDAGIDLVNSVCPTGEWIKNIPTAVSAADCGKNLGGLEAGKTFHTIYQVSDDQKLSIGKIPDGIDASNPETRGDDLSPPMVKS